MRYDHQILVSHGSASIDMLARKRQLWSRGGDEISRIGAISIDGASVEFTERCLSLLASSSSPRSLRVTFHDDVGHHYSFPLIRRTRNRSELNRIAQAQFAHRFDFDPNEFEIAVDVSQEDECICFAVPRSIMAGWQSLAKRSRVHFHGCAPHYVRRINTVRHAVQSHEWVAVLADTSITLGRMGTHGLRGVRVHNVTPSANTLASCISRDQLIYRAAANAPGSLATSLRVIGTSNQLDAVSTAIIDLQISMMPLPVPASHLQFALSPGSSSFNASECIALAALS